MFFALFERFLNRLIDESTPAARLARDLSGTSMEIVVTGLPISVVLEAGDEGITLRPGPACEASVRVSGSMPDLLRLTGPDPLTRVQRSRVEISGDPEVAEAYGKLLGLAAPDPEEELARWIGDIAGHRVAETVRATIRSAQRSCRALEANASEYLQHETGLLPTAAELRDFYEEVDDMREDVDRSVARLERLSRRTD